MDLNRQRRTSFLIYLKVNAVIMVFFRFLNLVVPPGFRTGYCCFITSHSIQITVFVQRRYSDQATIMILILNMRSTGSCLAGDALKLKQRTVTAPTAPFFSEITPCSATRPFLTEKI